MLQFKSVSVERLIFTCDRCGCSMSAEDDVMEWQERFIFSFRAGYGSVFGDGNYVEGDFCQKCIQSVLGKWLRVVDDDPFESRHKPSQAAEKIFQSYQFQKNQEEKRLHAEIADIANDGNEIRQMREKLAERLGVAVDQVNSIAYDFMMQNTESKS